MRASLPWMAACLLAAGAGMAAGRWTSHPPSAKHTRPPVAATAGGAPDESSPASLTAHLDESDLVAIRGMIREEVSAGLAAARPTAAASSAPTPAEPASPASEVPDSPQALHAFDEARAAIDDGVARGTWSVADRQQLRADLAQLPTETRLELEHTLIAAVTEKRVRFDGRGPLF